MSLTIARQVGSHAWQALTHEFISPESSLSHSVAHALHASAHARQAWTMSGLWLAIRSADRSQNLAQSATRCRALAYSFFPAATCVLQKWNVSLQERLNAAQTFKKACY